MQHLEERKELPILHLKANFKVFMTAFSKIMCNFKITAESKRISVRAAHTKGMIYQSNVKGKIINEPHLD